MDAERNIFGTCHVVSRVLIHLLFPNKQCMFGCAVLQTMFVDSSCVCCGRSLGPKEGVDVDAEDAWKVIQKRIKLDNHMQAHHPNHPWTPVSMAMVRDAKVQRELAQMLDANPDVQLNGPPFNSLAGEPTSIVDKPWSAKVRKVMTYGGVEFW